jgi:Putative transposase DNA-binding domain
MFGRRSKGFVQMYEYGCRNTVIGGFDAALDQMERRVRLWNKFVAIEKGIRQRARVLLSDDAEYQQINEVQQRVALLRAALLQGRRAEGRRGPGIEDLRNQLLALKAVLATVRAHARRKRNERFACAKDALKLLQEERARLAKQAEHESGLYWCNYSDVRYAYEVARVRAMRTNTELREHQWNGSGQVSVRFQRGLPVRTAFTCRGRRLQIDPVPEEAWTSPMRSTRRKLSRSRVRIRVASTHEQLPVWFEIPVVIHRPMPPDGLIRRASLIRERLGLAWRYRLILTVARAQSPASVSRERPSIGIDIGWRLVPEGLRVAFWADTLNRQGSLSIPASDLEEFAKVRGLWSVLGKSFPEVRSAVLGWLKGKSIPEALLPHFVNVTERQSAEDLLRLLEIWQKHRCEGDETVFDQLLAWKSRHVHLWTWAVNLRDQLTRKRLEIFRHFAAGLVKEYGAVFLEDFDLRWLSRIPPAEVDGIPIGAKYRVIAAPGILQQAIENACRRTGVLVTRTRARNTTKTCHVCGRIGEWNAAKKLVHACGCGAVWDQDYNAAVQILRAGVAQIDEQPSPECDVLGLREA